MEAQNRFTIEVLKSEHVSGTKGDYKYSFYRHAVIVKLNGVVVEVGDLVTDNEIKPGAYPAVFQVGSYQGKITAKILPYVGGPSQNKP